MLATIGVISFALMIVYLVGAIFSWKRKNGRVKTMLIYAVGFFVLYLVMLTINNSIYPAPRQVSHVAKSNSSTVPVAANTTTKPSEAGQKTKQTDAQKAADDQAKKDKAAADAKATQQAELQALGDWDIKSNSDDFANRYAQIQKYISQGDRQSAYDEATMASKRADDLNSKTMNNQDMDNVPKDIPSDIRDTLNGVDPHLAQGYMLEKGGFDSLSDSINKNDLSKIDEAKQQFYLANQEFTQAKALIDKANAALK